jgi:maltose-binding protein MalE
MEFSEVNFPIWLKCDNKAHFESLNSQAAILINQDYYQLPLIDKFGNYYFTVNSEVQSLVDLSKCVEFELIEMEDYFND